MFPRPACRVILNYVKILMRIVFCTRSQEHKEAILLLSMSKTHTTAAFSEDNVAREVRFSIRDKKEEWPELILDTLLLILIQMGTAIFPAACDASLASGGGRR